MKHRSFASDNNAPVAPEVLQAIVAANDGDAVGYGDDAWTARAVARFREHFGEETDVYFTFNGTGANIVALSCLTMPWESVLRLPRARREEREARALAEDALSFFGQRLAGYRWDQPAYSLSYANRRRLEIARALATRPRLLLLDEPAAGMNPAETHEVTELIGRIRDERGVAILVIEHDMHVVSGCSDRVVALDHGVKIAEGGFDAVAGHPAVVEAYMGRHPEDLAGASE